MADSSSAAPANSPAGWRVAGDHEHLAHARRAQAEHDLLEVPAVAHEAGRQVRHHGISARN
jgi:hypothetical protein